MQSRRHTVRRAVVAAAVGVGALAGCTAESPRPATELSEELALYANAWAEEAPWPEVPEGTRLTSIKLVPDTFAYWLNVYLPTGDGGHFWTVMCVAREAEAAEAACGWDRAPVIGKDGLARVVLSEHPDVVSSLPMVASPDSLQRAALNSSEDVSVEKLTLPPRGNFTDVG